MKLSESQQATAIDMALQGKRLKEIRETIGVTVGVFSRALESDISFAAKFHRARALGHDERAEEVLTVADDEQDVQRARLKSDNLKWYLSKLKPETYGDRIDVNLNQTVDIGGALAEARARIPLAQQTQHIKDVHPIESDSTKSIDTSGSKSVESTNELKSIDDLIE